MERLSERLTSVEAILKKLDPIESLLERIALLEKNIYTTKQVFTFQEACMYIGIMRKIQMDCLPGLLGRLAHLQSFNILTTKMKSLLAELNMRYFNSANRSC